MARSASFVGIVFGLTVAGVAASQGPPAPPAAAQNAPACTASEDAEFAYTPQKAVRIGGGPAYMAVRERRYLDSLKGPAGQTVTHRRLGQAHVPGESAILDRWEVTYEGLSAPIHLYLDAYHFDEPQAPRGFTCAPFTLSPPPVDPFMATDQMVRLAIQQGASREFPPISLDADGSATHGVAFDRFRMIARFVNTSTAAGVPIDPTTPLSKLGSFGLVLVGYPIKCGDRSVMPVSIDIAPSQGLAPRRDGAIRTGEELVKLLPGFATPGGTIAAVFTLAALRPSDAVRVTYAEAACPGTAEDVLLPVRFAAAKPASLPPPSLPAGFAAPQPPVWLQAVVDVDGQFQQPAFIGGPNALSDAALSTIKGWRAQPAQMNGTPIVAETLLVVRFR